jgi:hypothetical protein
LDVRDRRIVVMEATLRSIAGAVGEFASADGKNIVEKIDFLRKDYQEQVKNLEEYMLKGVAFRDELQGRVKRLEEALVNLMKSSDVSWYTGAHGGHDWREAIDAAHNTLVKCSRRTEDGSDVDRRPE